MGLTPSGPAGLDYARPRRDMLVRSKPINQSFTANCSSSFRTGIASREPNSPIELGISLVCTLSFLSGHFFPFG